MGYSENPPMEDFLMHYGRGHLDGGNSGRYKWGSGKDPYQHSSDFLSRVNELRKKGFSDSEIAESMGIMSRDGKTPSSTRLRTQISLASEEERSERRAQAVRLRESGMSLDAIAKEMGFKNDSSVRTLLDENIAARKNQSKETAAFLIEQVKEKGMIDVGKGIEKELGISREKLETALYMAELEGYERFGARVPQINNPGKWTTIQVLCKPGTEHKDIYNYEDIKSITDYKSEDGGETFNPKFVFPESMNSSRLMIRYAEDGGIKKDGVAEIRPGVEDLDIGGHYAQVRILVDGKKYIKGMAVYGDEKDFPPGVDVIFNTNKGKDKSKLECLKDVKIDKTTGEIDKENPFGSLIKEDGGQHYYIGKDGKKHLSLINKRAEEGDWGEWADKLPSQFLGKQNLSLINRQLELSKKNKQAEFDEICSLTNPTVKKVLLKSFADDCDAAAVHLKAAALPRQKYQVLLPLTSIKDNEIYAPNYKNGEKVALVRYPHGGTFEIPILTVNNKNAEGKRVISKDAKDAIGINSKVAERLSGADFDGDTAMVIPTAGNGKNMGVNITSTKPLKGLEGFDNKLSYGHDPHSEIKDENGKILGYTRGGVKFKAMHNTQTEMGMISNLITDMTIKGAKPDELARATRHSMVVIDAEKHGLDYKQSAKDNGIAELKRKYQGEVDPKTGRMSTGAATLLSRAKGQTQVLKRKGSPKIDPNTGELIWNSVKETYTDKDGKTKYRTQKSTKMYEAKDANELVSKDRHPKELAYANYANFHKDLANKARLTMINTGKIATNSSAKKTYAQEVKSLDEKLLKSELNAPRERKAQIMANAEVKAKKQANPDMTKAEEKKFSQRALSRSRAAVGAKRTTIDITDREWEAIQSGAISESKLVRILNHTDTDKIKQLATPKTSKSLTSGQINRAKALHNQGYTNAQIAEMMGKSPSTISSYLND